VLSPSTAGTDFTEKRDEYTSVDTLQTYLICSQDEPRAWVWSRQGDGSWPRLPRELIGREERIALGDWVSSWRCRRSSAPSPTRRPFPDRGPCSRSA
jgi:Uma2 family endonuclease